MCGGGHQGRRGGRDQRQQWFGDRNARRRDELSVRWGGRGELVLGLSVVHDADCSGSHSHLRIRCELVSDLVVYERLGILQAVVAGGGRRADRSRDVDQVRAGERAAALPAQHVVAVAHDRPEERALGGPPHHQRSPGVRLRHTEQHRERSAAARPRAAGRPMVAAEAEASPRDGAERPAGGQLRCGGAPSTRPPSPSLAPHPPSSPSSVPYGHMALPVTAQRQGDANRQGTAQRTMMPRGRGRSGHQ